MKFLPALFVAAMPLFHLSAQGPHSANPILPGYNADPTIVQDGGKEYIYATLDPWGGETVGCWESSDFKNWTYRTLNWPTKKACTSPTSKTAMVWAPSVVHGPDGKFYMVVSVGNEILAPPIIRSGRGGISSATSHSSQATSSPAST